jgi:PDZ domain
VLLTLIGPDWITDLQRRHGRDDFVILEIGTALTRGIRVIPVLVDGAAIPTEASLPPDIRSLTRRNAVRLDHETFQSDVERLLAAVEKALQPNHATAGASTARLPIVGPIIPAHRDAAAFPPPQARAVVPAPRLPEGGLRPRSAPSLSSPPHQPRRRRRHPAILPIAICWVSLAVGGLTYWSAAGGSDTPSPTPPTTPTPTRPPTAWATIPATLGVEMETVTGPTGLAIGVGVDSVVWGSPAARAGLRAGDRITALDGRSVLTTDALGWAVRARSAGDVARIGFVRDGVVRDAVVVF